MAFAAPRAARFNRVPIRLTPFGSEFHVLRAERASADLNGARLVAIDGHPVARLRDAARTLAGGVPAWRDRFAGFLFESPEQLHALGLAAKPDAALYRFETLDGRTVERALAARPAGGDSPAGGSGITTGSACAATGVGSGRTGFGFDVVFAGSGLASTGAGSARLARRVLAAFADAAAAATAAAAASGVG